MLCFRDRFSPTRVVGWRLCATMPSTYPLRKHVFTCGAFPRTSYVVLSFIGNTPPSDSLPASAPFTLRFIGPTFCRAQHSRRRGGSPQFRLPPCERSVPHTPEGSNAGFQITTLSAAFARYERLGSLCLSAKKFHDAAGFTLCCGLFTCSRSLGLFSQPRFAPRLLWAPFGLPTRGSYVPVWPLARRVLPPLVEDSFSGRAISTLYLHKWKLSMPNESVEKPPTGIFKFQIRGRNTLKHFESFVLGHLCDTLFVPFHPFFPRRGFSTA